MRLEFRGEIYVVNINFWVVSMEMVVKVMRLDEIIDGIGLIREESFGVFLGLEVVNGRRN